MHEQTALTDRIAQGMRREAERIEEDAEHSGKRHFNSCHRWSMWHYALGMPATVAAVLTSTALLKNAPDLAQFLGLCGAVLVALMTFLKPNDRAAQHRSVGNQYLALRNEARMFRELDLLKPTDENKKSEILNRLARRRDELNSVAPNTSRGAFEQARRGIEEGETAYKVDKPASSHPL